MHQRGNVLEKLRFRVDVVQPRTETRLDSVSTQDIHINARVYYEGCNAPVCMFHELLPTIVNLSCDAFIFDASKTGQVVFLSALRTDCISFVVPPYNEARVLLDASPREIN